MQRIFHKIVVLTCPLVWLLNGPACSADVKPDTAQVQFFEKQVRPLLVTHCLKCHGSKKQKGGLRLDSRMAVLKGGDSGPAFNSKKPERSLLLEAIGYGADAVVQMPPSGKLKPQPLAVLTKWIKMGAPWPEQNEPTPSKPNADGPLFTKAEQEFWAFQPPRDPDVPEVKDGGWSQSDLDRFILSKLQAKQLTPSPRADKRTLIRRATFDLTGLPPTPQDIENFLADDSPEAFSKVIDRLLASPRYGERWGRHWLDVARYADSNGMDENLAYANAFRYRDYVIAAFNKDKPYDQFVREQLAGDLMPVPGDLAVTLERQVATGFLVVGPKMLAEDDPVKMQMDIVDEQIDTLGRAFMGLWLGCARCHEHKFDPIPTEDYYSLAGIFKSTKTMENFKVVARWYERPLATPAAIARQEAHNKRIVVTNAEINRRTESANQQLLAAARKDAVKYVKAAGEVVRFRAEQSKLESVLSQPDGDKVPGVVLIEAEDYARGNVKKDFATYGKSIGVLVNQGKLPNFAEYEVDLQAARAYQLEMRLAAAAARPTKLFLNGKLVKPDAASTVTGSWTPESQRWTVEGVFLFNAGKNIIRLERAEPFPHIDKLALVPRKIEQTKTGLAKSPAELVAQHGLNLVFLNQWADFLVRTEQKADVLLAKSPEVLRKVLDDPNGPLAVPKDIESYYAASEQGELKRLREELKSLEKSKPVLPLAMGVTEGNIENARVNIRGNHVNLGEEVVRQFPRILAGEQQTPIDGKQSGRLQLARWLTEPNHPLTSRVMVNRIWRWHFGAGLVRTPDNFGRMGDQPVHRELLDWLAVRFVENGWSIKATHRLIMHSATYQMSTAYNRRAATTDPENRLHWRMSRRRLDAESIRDALLAVADSLDLTMGGATLSTKNRAYVTSTRSVDPTNYKTNRRSVYLPVVRSALYEVFQAFDFPDPSSLNGNRATTTVAPQALFMLNSQFVDRQTRAMAEKLLAQTNLDATARVAGIYVKALGRSPTQHEVGRALEFIQRYEQALSNREMDASERHATAWQGLCRVVVASNDFIYVE